MKFIYTLLLCLLGFPVFAQFGSGQGSFGTIGNLASSGGAVSNVVPYAIGITNFDNTNWMAIQATRMNEWSSVNQGKWTNVIANIASGKNFLLEEDGSGLVNQGLFTTTWSMMTNNLPLIGVRGLIFPYCYLVAGDTPGTQTGAETSTNWFQVYQIFYTNTCNVYVIAGINWNVVEISMSTSANGATYKLQTNNGSGGPNVDVGGVTWSGVSTVNGETNIYWTNGVVFGSGVGLSYAHIVQTGAGTNNLLNAGVWDNTRSNGMFIGSQTATSAGFYQMVNVATNYTMGFYRDLNPDLILLESIEGADATNVTAISNVISMYTNFCPNATIVVCGTYPIINNNSTVTAANYMLSTNVAQFRNDGRTKIAYFDGYTPMQDATNEINRGFYANGSGDPHLGPTGYAAYGYFLYKWLNLDEMQVFGTYTVYYQTNAPAINTGYTNSTPYTMTWRVPVTVSSPATTVGRAKVDAKVSFGGALSVVARAELAGGATSILDTNYATLVFDVPPGAAYTVTNDSSGTGYVGAIDSTATNSVYIHP